MEEICTLRKWGNSVGLIVPREILKEGELYPGDKIKVNFGDKENPLKELRGALRFTKSTKQLLKEIREEMVSKWD